MGLHEFVTLLKAEKPRNDKRINQLAQRVDIGDTYNEVDVLTLTIYYTHRDAFDILIKRKADLNPMFYQNIPPHLWSLEVFYSDEYFFRQLVDNPKINLFQKSKNYSENILFNMCSKLHDTSLFKEVFQKLENKDTKQLSELFGIDVFHNKEPVYPLYGCLQYLNYYYDYSKFDKSELEENCLKRLGVLLNYQKCLTITPTFSNSSVIVTNILEYLVSKTKLIRKTPKFVRRLIDYLQTFPDFDKCLQEYTDCLIHCAKYENLEILEYFINLGAIQNNKNKPNVISEAIRLDNLEMIQFLHNKGFSLNTVYSETKLLNGKDIIKGYRNIHLAIIYNSYRSYQYLISELKESLDRKRSCNMTPKKLIKYLSDNDMLSKQAKIIMLSKTLTYSKFCKHIKHECEECSICLDSLKSSSMIMLKCGHVFHANCILTNLKTSDSCPYCRAPTVVSYMCHNT